MSEYAMRRARIIMSAGQVRALLGLHPDLTIEAMVSSPLPSGAEVSIFVTSPHLPMWKPGAPAPQLALDDSFAGVTVGGNYP